MGVGIYDGNGPVPSRLMVIRLNNLYEDLSAYLAARAVVDCCSNKDVLNIVYA